MAEVQFANVGARGRKAIVRGYIYTRQRAGNDHTWSHWFCVRRHKGCRGRIHISPDERNYKVTAEHDHIPSYGECKAKLALSALRTQAQNEPNSNPLHLTQGVLVQADSETLVSLPKENSMKRTIQRIRRQHQPALPTTINDIVEIPEQYATIEGENWVQYNNFGNEENGRIIIFATQDSIRHLSRSAMWYGDGTFKCVPRILCQLYTLHYEANDNVLMGCFALMQNKTEASYEEMFRAVRDMLPPQDPEVARKFSCDFELAATNAISRIFVNISYNYCFFHFSQSLWRKAQMCGVAGAYGQEDEHELRSQFHACIALAYVPTEHVQAAFLDLRETADKRLDEVLDLLEDFYIMGRRRGRGRATPRYPIHTWNVYERTIQGLPRTNNTVEAWNRRWKTVVGKSHPNIFLMLEKIKKRHFTWQASRS